ncbi:hypothetical protein V8C26DRAFT_285088 [Trichoderma gracile]
MSAPAPGLSDNRPAAVPPVTLSDDQFSRLFGRLLDTTALQSTSPGGIKDYWKITHIGYFDPGAEDDAVSGNTVVWNTVDQFVESIQDNATTDERRGHIALNLPQLLRGPALHWWGSLLLPQEKHQIKQSVDNWIAALTKQFQLDQVDAVTQLTKQQYTDDNCRNGLDIRPWAMKFFRLATAAGFTTNGQQLSQLYLHISPSLRELVLKPHKTMSKNDYLEHLRDKQQARTSALTALADGNSGQQSSTDVPWATQILHDKRLLALPAASFTNATTDQSTYYSGNQMGQQASNQQPTGQQFGQNMRGGTTQFRPYTGGGQTQFWHGRGGNNFRQTQRGRGYGDARRERFWRDGKYWNRRPGNQNRRRYRRWSRFSGDSAYSGEAEDICINIEDPAAEKIESELNSQGYQMIKEFKQSDRKDNVAENKTVSTYFIHKPPVMSNWPGNRRSGRTVLPFRPHRRWKLTDEVIPEAPTYACRKCQKEFPSRSKLMCHVYSNECGHQQASSRLKFQPEQVVEAQPFEQDMLSRYTYA